MWRTIAYRIAVGLVAAFCVLYVADYLVLRYRMARGGEASVTDTVTVFFGTPLKDGRTEIFTDEPETQTCSRSIFPHLGYPACWYAKRHPTKVITESDPVAPRRVSLAVQGGANLERAQESALAIAPKSSFAQPKRCYNSGV